MPVPTSFEYQLGLKRSLKAALWLALAAWLILISGVSAVQADFGRNVRSVLGLPWFILCLQFLVIGLTYPWEALQTAKPPFKFPLVSRPALFTLLAVSATLCVLQTDYWCGFSGAKQGRINATKAGFLLTALANMAIILLLGLDDTLCAETLPPQQPAAPPAAPAMPAKTAPFAGSTITATTPTTAQIGTSPASPQPAVESAQPKLGSHPVRISEVGQAEV